MPYVPPSHVKVTVELEPRLADLVDTLAHATATERASSSPVRFTVELEPRLVELVDSLAHMRAKERGPVIRDMVLDYFAHYRPDEAASVAERHGAKDRGALIRHMILDYLIRYRQGYDRVAREIQGVSE